MRQYKIMVKKPDGELVQCTNGSTYDFGEAMDMLKSKIAEWERHIRRYYYDEDYYSHDRPKYVIVSRNVSKWKEEIL